MDLGHFKGLLWLHFWCQTFSSIIFIVEKCVHFDIWNKKISKMSQIIGGDPLKKFFIPNIKMYTFFHHKSVGGKMPGTKNEVTVAL